MTSFMTMTSIKVNDAFERRFGSQDEFTPRWSEVARTPSGLGSSRSTFIALIRRAIIRPRDSHTEFCIQ